MEFFREKKRSVSLRMKAVKNGIARIISNFAGKARNIPSSKLLVYIIISTLSLCLIIVMISISSVSKRKRRSLEGLASNNVQSEGARQSDIIAEDKSIVFSEEDKNTGLGNEHVILPDWKLMQKPVRKEAEIEGDFSDANADLVGLELLQSSKEYNLKDLEGSSAEYAGVSDLTNKADLQNGNNMQISKYAQESAQTEIRTSAQVFQVGESFEILKEETSSSGENNLTANITQREKDNEIQPVLTTLGKVRYRNYTVKTGESVKNIADSAGLRTQTIIQVNSLKTVYPEAGTVLLIPNMDGQLYKVEKGDSVFSLINKFSLSISWNTFKAINGLESDSLNEGDVLFIPYSGMSDKDFVIENNVLDNAFRMPLKNESMYAGFSRVVQDPLSGEFLELDGILLQTPGTSDVCSVQSGSVVDKGFNANGTYFIKVSHPDGYTSYYNYLTWANVKVGDRLTMGEYIGTISEGNTLLGRPTLYFKIEQDGIPLDPAVFF